MKRAALVVLVAALAAAAPAQGAILKVNCKTGGNLQAKLNAAAAGSTILIKGTCHGTFLIAKKVTLKGNPAATLDGDDAGSVVFVNGVPVRFVDLRIVDGSATNGGGVYSAAGKLTFLRTTVSGNVASNAGGGIAATAPVVLQNSLVSGNKVVQSSSGPQVMGGGIFATQVTLTRSTVRSNLAHAIGAANPTRAYGGGIFLTGAGSLVAKRSHIDKNTARANGPSATALGGAVTQQSGAGPALRFTDSTLNGNKALGNAIVGTGYVQGGAVQAGRVRASRTEFVGNRLDLTAALGAGNATGGALALGTTASRLTSVKIRKTRVEVDALTNALIQGGGIAAGTPTAKLTITRSTISGTVATVSSSGSVTANGGGIASPGDLVLVRSTVSGNSLSATSTTSTATASGGGVRAQRVLSVQTSTISGNTAKSLVGPGQATSSGGGIAVVTSPELATIVNSTITKNSVKGTANTAGIGPIAVGYGGGIYIANSTLRLTNTTVARNSASAKGALSAEGGGGAFASTATLELRGSLLAANTALFGRDCDGLTTSLGYNLIGSLGNCNVTPKPSDKTNKAAKLGAFGDHGGPTLTIPLLNGSPALNAIPKSSCKVKSDQRGVKRPQQKKCEMGAWERRP